MKTKMAEEREVVRVTYKDLEEIVQRDKLSLPTKSKEELDSSTKDNQKRKAKRPERSIYRPGVSRLRKVSSSQDESDSKASEDTATTTTNVSPPACSSSKGWDEQPVETLTKNVQELDLYESDANKSPIIEPRKPVADAKGRRRRPDIQIYVPKGKLQEKESGDVTLEDLHDDADSEFSPDPPEQSEEEVTSLANAPKRKVNITKAKDRNMCITVVNEELNPPKSAEASTGTGFLKTMIFERGGSGLPADDSSVNLPEFNKGGHAGSYNEPSSAARKPDKVTAKSPKVSKSSEMSQSDVLHAREPESNVSDSQTKPGQDSPSGKSSSKRYSLAKRKQRNGNGNGTGNGKSLPNKSTEESTNEADSDAQLDEIENLAPMVLDWNEEVERELGTEQETVPEQSNVKSSSESVRGKSRGHQRGVEKREKGGKRRQEFQGKPPAEVEILGRQNNRNTSSNQSVRSPPNRRSSFDSATWTQREGTRQFRGDSDAESDITDHQGKRKNRRRKERKRTLSGPGNTDRKDAERGGLKVTIDRNERQVEVENYRYRRRYGQDTHSSREHLSSDSDIHSPKGGGILHLVPASDRQGKRGGDDHRRNTDRQRSHEHLPSRGDNRAIRTAREGSRGGGGQRTLFDPSNPLKPIVIQSGGPKLQFKETGKSSPHTPSPYEPYGPQYPPNPYPGYSRGYPEAPYHHYPMGNPADQYYYPYPGVFEESSSCGDDTYAKDPYYHSGYDPDYVIGGMSRSQCRAMADLILRDAGPLDCQLANILSRRIHSEGEQLLNKLRHDLKTKYEQVILLDPDLTNKHNVEQLLWKNVYYQVIEIYRRRLGDQEDEDSRTDLLTILDEATAFYEALLQKLQQTYSFRLDLFLDVNHPVAENLSRAVKLALLSGQRTMICLGDIARYREQALGKMNYGKARSWYMKAQQIAPKNGRPYNQLAILALYTKRKLDAVYYYMRSLAASNPFLTARESLMSLFDEARKKAEATEQKRHEEREKLKKWRRRREKEGPRIEIWISPDGRSQAGQVEENYEEDLNQMTPVELNKRVSLSFLNSHGKLFTKIGMETFDEVCGQLLMEFQAVLSRRPTVISNNRLIQLMAMNMFAVDNTALKGERIESNCRSLLQEHAVQQGLEMFAILSCQFTSLLQAHMETKDYPSRLFSDDLHELVSSIKVWSDWMLCHPALWNPAPNVNDPETSFKIDVWKEVAEMFNVLKEVDISHVKLYRDKKEGCDPVILEEDNALAGFVPLLSAPSEPMFVHATVEKHIAKDCLRIQKLQTFGDYLCGIEPPMLAYNVETRKYYSVAPSAGYDDEESPAKDGHLSDDDDVIIESEEEVESGEEGEHGLKELRAKKQELERRVQEQAKQKENVEAILEKHRHRAIELQVCPVFLVPDTNCFINYLTALKKLLNSKKFTLVVPLIVINELDGLTKGGSRGHPHDVAYQQHITFVSNHAKQAVQLLENEFEKRNPHLKALTSKGSTLETISFRSEETDSGGVNDDVILSCCLHYCRDVARDFMPKSKDTPIRLQRDVVLLTDDRNLRLKAHTRNVPVKDVPSFLRWANIT